MESTYLSWSSSGFYQESIRSLPGVHQESIRSPSGCVGECNLQTNGTTSRKKSRLDWLRPPPARLHTLCNRFLMDRTGILPLGAQRALKKRGGSPQYSPRLLGNSSLCVMH